MSELGTGRAGPAATGSSSRRTRATAPTSSCPLAGTVLTNVETDHLDHYGTFDDIVAGFDRYLAGSRRAQGGLRRRPRGRGAGRAPRRRDLRHRADGALPGRRRRGPSAATSTFGVRRDGEPLGESSTSRCAGSTTSATPRRVVALADLVGVPFDATARALGRFGGVGRRFDVRGAGTTGSRSSTTTPTSRPRSRRSSRRRRRAVTGGSGSWRSSSPTASTGWRSCRPRTATPSCTPTSPSSPTSTPPARPRSRASPASSWSTRCCDAHPDQRVVWVRERAELVSFLARELRAGDVCISMGCGDVERLPDEILAVWQGRGGR